MQQASAALLLVAPPRDAQQQQRGRAGLHRRPTARATRCAVHGARRVWRTRARRRPSPSSSVARAPGRPSGGPRFPRAPGWPARCRAGGWTTTRACTRHRLVRRPRLRAAALAARWRNAAVLGGRRLRWTSHRRASCVWSKTSRAIASAPRSSRRTWNASDNGCAFVCCVLPRAAAAAPWSPRMYLYARQNASKAEERRRRYEAQTQRLLGRRASVAAADAPGSDSDAISETPPAPPVQPANTAQPAQQPASQG